MFARLFCRVGKLAGKYFHIDKDVLVGRNPKHAIALTEKAVSDQHARIFFDTESNGYVIEDLESTNGTMVDGIALNGRMRLERLHVITFAGKFDFIFQTMPGEYMSVSDMPPPDDRRKTVVPGEEVLKAPVIRSEISENPRYAKTDNRLDPLRMPGAGAGKSIDSRKPDNKAPSKFMLQLSAMSKLFELHEGVNLIGRSKKCDIYIDHTSVSRRHASLAISGDQAVITDLGSKNKTYVNSREITSAVTVPPGAEIILGSISARLINGKSKS